MTIITRIAPSPTGYLHVGNVRTALVNWLFAKKNNGKFLLRIDDTDLGRSKKEYEDAIKQDLKWLGLDWDDNFNQKDRLDRYEQIKNSLIASGRLYPCYETQEELLIKRKIMLTQGKPPVYDRASLNLSQEKLRSFEAQGRKPHFRFKLEPRKVTWDDMIRGIVEIDPTTMSDPIFIREDGTWTYMLCSVVDDIDYKISHIIRGDDHVANTAVQIQLFEALSAQMPIFGHLPRITTKNAEISKRTGGFDIATLRDQKEIEAMTINNFLGTIGTSTPFTHFTNLNDLIKIFDITSYHKSPTTYEEQDLLRLNAKILEQYSYLEACPDRQVPESFWEVVKHNVQTRSEVTKWWDICTKDVSAQIFDPDNMLDLAAELLPPNIDENTWPAWISEIKQRTGKFGKDLFMPIRCALTGLDDGPELKRLLPFIGYEAILKRLKNVVKI